MDYIVTGTSEKDKAIEAHIGISIQEWLQHAYENKARKCIERIVAIVSDKQPKKMSEQEKIDCIGSIDFMPQSDERQELSIDKRIIYP